MSDERATAARHSRQRTAYPVCRADALAPGDRLLITLDGRTIGVFNIGGQYYALHNRCPHAGGNLCQGPLTGTALPTDRREYVYGLEGQVLRCAWHGWEFRVDTGECLASPRIRARTFPVTIEDDMVLVHV
jgi:nitrite reductase/ring-hydroxylating ferredoxin subunit